MKKLFLSLLTAAAVAPAFAQVGLTNSWVAYASGVYGSSRGERNAGNVQTDFPVSRVLGLNLGLGYQFTQNWAVGVNFQLEGSAQDNQTNVVGTVAETRNRALAIGPFVRYTMPINQHFFWFTQADFSYLSGKNRTTVNGTPDTETEVDANGVRGRLFPSVGVQFSRTMSLAFNVGGVQYNYGRTDLGANVEEKGSNLNVNFGQVVNFTVQKYFGGRKYGYGRQPMDETRRLDTSDDDMDDDRPRRRRNRDMDDE